MVRLVLVHYARVGFAILLLLLAGCAARPLEVPATSIHLRLADAPTGTTFEERRGSVPVSEADNGLTQLLAFAQRESIEVETTRYESMDATFVNAIGGLAAQPGPDGRYYFWLFVVNGNSWNEAAEDLPLKENDAVEWVYTLSNGP